MKKINIIWSINLIVFAFVVFLGIEQAGKGAEISKIERDLESQVVLKRELSEKIFRSGSENKLTDENVDHGFIKPSKIVYFNSEEASLTLK
jgi:hypothetical protein